MLICIYYKVFKVKKKQNGSKPSILSLRETQNYIMKNISISTSCLSLSRRGQMISIF